MKNSFKTLFWLLFVLAGWTSNQAAYAQNTNGLTLKITNGIAILTISGASTNTCLVESTTNLPALNQWQSVTYVSFTNNTAHFSDTNPLSARCFYRVLIGQSPTGIIPITNMVWLVPGSFAMGSSTNEALRSPDETQYTAVLTQGFYIGKFLVTQSDYQTLMATNPSYYNSANGYPGSLSRPVEQVAWTDASNYCAVLTRQETLAGRIPSNWSYRLPTETEWEYACRAGTTTAFYLGNDLSSGMANFNGQYEYDSTQGTITNATGIFLNETTPVGSYTTNSWGLYDMCGNVSEWCQDWYGNYPSGMATNPQGPATGVYHVVRGGSYNYEGAYCRSAQRGYAFGNFKYLGFRVILAPN